MALPFASVFALGSMAYGLYSSYYPTPLTEEPVVATTGLTARLTASATADVPAVKRAVPPRHLGGEDLLTELKRVLAKRRAVIEPDC